MNVLYLSDPIFAEPPAGPWIDAGRRGSRRDPSPEQIASRSAAIRRAVPRRLVGESNGPYEVDVVRAADLFGERDVGR